MAESVLSVSWGHGRSRLLYGDTVWVKNRRLAYIAAAPPGTVAPGHVPVLYIDLPRHQMPSQNGLPIYQVPMDDVDLLPL